MKRVKVGKGRSEVEVRFFVFFLFLLGGGNFGS